MLEIRAARKMFHRGQADEKVALDGLDLTLATGEFGVVIGTNGAGKSSMLNAVSGSLSIDTGQILINGQDVTQQPVHRRAARVARVFQDSMKGTAASMTVAENMLLAELRGKERAADTAHETARALHHALHFFGHLLGQRCGEGICDRGRDRLGNFGPHRQRRFDPLFAGHHGRLSRELRDRRRFAQPERSHIQR